MFLRPLKQFRLLLSFACLLAIGLGRPFAAEPDLERHIALGMPAKASAEESNKDAYLLKKEFFTISYNDTKGTPNWVAWNLVKSDFGTAKRPVPAPFHPDAELPATFHKVTPADYKFSNTAFDRGHMCPNADRDQSKERATTTFVMTNMIPQTHELNGKAWAKLESYCRTLVDEEEHELYIFAGPVGKGGWSAKGFFNTTNGRVVVPAKCWKVIVCLPIGQGDPVDRIKETEVPQGWWTRS